MIPNSPSPQTLSLQQWAMMMSVGFIILLIHQYADQTLNAILMDLMQKESSSFAFIAASMFLNGLLIVWVLPLFFISFMQTLHPETALIPFLTKTQDYTREWLRGMGEASLWMFVLVIPGLLRWVEYTMLPFICFFDPAYQNGEVDALKQCRKILRGHRWKLWFLWLGFGIILPLILTSAFSDYESLREHPWAGSALVLVETMIQVLAFWLFWRLYLQIQKPSAQTMLEH